MTQKGSVMRSILSSYLLYFLIVPFGYIIRLLYTHSLSLEEFGLVYSILGFAAFFNILIDLGLTDAFRYYASELTLKKKYKDIADLFWRVLWTHTTAIVVLAGIIMVFASALATHYFHYPQATATIIFFVGMFVFFNLTDSARSMLVIYNKQPFGYTLELIRSIFIISASTFFFLNDMVSTEAYALAWLGAAVIIAVAYYVSLFKIYPWLLTHITFRFANKKLLNYGGLTIMTSLGTTVFQAIDLWIIVYFLGLASSAIYSNALSILSLLDMLFAPLAIFLLPIIAQHKSNPSVIKKDVQKLFEIGMYLTIPFAITLFFFAKEFVLLLFGQEYVGAAVLIQLFAGFVIFKGFFSYSFQILSGLGRLTKKLQLLLVAIIFNVTFDLLVLPHYGLIGVAAVTGISWLLVFIMSWHLIAKEIGNTISLKYVGKLVGSGVLFTALIYGLRLLPGMHIIFRIIIICGCAYAVHLIVGYILRIYTKEDIETVVPHKYLPWKNKSS